MVRTAADREVGEALEEAAKQADDGKKNKKGKKDKKGGDAGIPVLSETSTTSFSQIFHSTVLQGQF